MDDEITLTREDVELKITEQKEKDKIYPEKENVIVKKYLLSFFLLLLLLKPYFPPKVKLSDSVTDVLPTSSSSSFFSPAPSP